MKEPKIRFKGFEGEWEKVKLGDVGIFKSNGVDKTIHNNEKIVNLLNYLDVYNARLVTKNNCHQLMHVSASDRQIKECDIQMNDVFFTPSSETAEDIGHVLVIKETLPNTCYSYHLLRYRPNKGIFYGDFPNYGFATKFVRSQMRLLAKGVQRYVIGKSEFESIVVQIPSISEQQSIASYFQHLDSLIQSTTKKIESLKQVKAASLQSMFPQEGETTPRVRFKGFEGEWEKVKFGEIAKISRGLTYSPFNLRDKGVRVLRSSNIDEDVFVISESDVFVNKECINIEYAEDGNILVTAANGSPRLVGKHAIINNIGTNPTVVGGFMLLISSNESAFLNASMSSIWYSNFLKVGVSGGNGAIGNLSKQDLEDTELLIPNKKAERNHIATYFTSLDRQITLQTQRLEKLKQIKAACLDNMFV